MACTKILGKPWGPGVDHIQHPHYQHIAEYTYWYVLVSFNNWNIIHFTNITTCREEFYEVTQVLIYVISSNMELLVQTSKYGAINAADPTTQQFMS